MMKTTTNTHRNARRVALLSICAFVLAALGVLIASGGQLSSNQKGMVESKRVTSSVQAVQSPSNVMTGEAMSDAASSSGPAKTWKHSLKHSYTAENGKHYDVTVQYNDDAEIPNDATLSVELVNNSDANAAKKRDEALKTHLHLEEGGAVLQNTYLAVKVMSGDKEVSIKAPVSLNIQTDAIDPASSDAVEIVPIGSEQAKASNITNLTEKEAGSEKPNPDKTSVSCTTNVLGEFGMPIVVVPKFTWNVDDAKMQLFGSRNTSVEVDDVPGDGGQVDELDLLNTFSMQTQPTHAWKSNLWLAVTNAQNISKDEYSGLLCYKVQDDGSLGDMVFGKANEVKHVPIDSKGTYALLWDRGLHEVGVQENNIRIEGTGPRHASADVQDVTSNYSDAKTVLGEEGDTKYDLETVAAYDVNFKVDGNEWEPGKNHAMSATVTDESVEQNSDVQVWYVGDNGQSTPVQQTNVQEDNVNFPMTDSGTYMVVERVSLERNFVASDNRTYKVTVSYDGSAGLPKNAELSVSEVAQESEEYKSFVARSAEEVGADAKSVKYAKALDIAIVDPNTGEHFHPTNDVLVTIELLDAGDQRDAWLEVVHFGEEVQNVEAEVQGNTATFTTNDFSVFVAFYTVDFHWGDYVYKITGESEVLLSEVLSELGVSSDLMNSIVDVSFSNTDLVQVEKKDGDWLLKSIAPFDSEEELTLTLANGETVAIKVTDAIAPQGTWNKQGGGVGGTWTIDDQGVMTLSGEGAMEDYGGVTSTPWNSYRKQIKKLVVENGITHLSQNMLTRAYNLEVVDAHDCTSLINAGDNLFKMNSYGGESGTGKLKTVNFSGCINFTGFEKTDGSYTAFQACKAIETIDISDTKISSNMIATYFADCKSSLRTLKASGCSNVKTVNVSAYTGLTTVDFSNCVNSGFNQLTIPKTVQDLNLSGSSSVATVTNLTSCTSMKNLNLSGTKIAGSLDYSGMTALETLNLSGCTGVTSLTLPASVTELNLSNCTGITSLTLPASVTTLNVDGCTNLKYIYIAGSPTGLNDLSSFGIRLNMDAKMVGNTTSVEGSTGVLILSKSMGATGIGVSEDSQQTTKLPELYAGLNSAVDALAADTNVSYSGGTIGEDQVAILKYEDDQWKYLTSGGETKNVDSTTALTLKYYEKVFNLTIKWVEKKDDGTLAQLDPRYTDGSYSVTETEWHSSATIIKDYLEEVVEIQDLDTAPSFIGKCFYNSLGLGMNTVQNAEELSYKDLSAFDLKNSNLGLLYRTDTTSDGSIAQNVNTLYVIYSTEPPAGSARLTVANNTNYALTINDVKVDGAVTVGTDKAIVADSDGTLSVFDNTHKVGAQTSIGFVLLGASGKKFVLNGGYVEGDRPVGFEAKAEIHSDGRIEEVSLKSQDSYDFGGLIYGGLYATDATDIASVSFWGEADRDVEVSKHWVDSSKMNEGEDQSNGNQFITVRFLNGDGGILELDPEKNHKLGVEIDAEQNTAKLSRIEGDWPEKWTVTVRESVQQINEVPVPDGYECTTSVDIANNKMDVTNTRYVCKIVRDGETHLFSSIRQAVEYAQDNNLTNVKIEMILSHKVTTDDAIEIPNGYHVTLTTAATTGLNPYVHGSGDEAERAMVKCAEGLQGSLITNEGILTLENIIIDGNKDAGPRSGAMIHNKSLTEVGVTTTLRNANNADGSGGAIYSESGDVTVSSNASITGNSAAKGGAIYAQSGSVTTSGTLSGNSATDEGGAIYYTGTSTLTVSGTISGNNATNNGGAISIRTGTLKFGDGNTEITGNSAKHGGAIYANSAAVNVDKNITVSNNQANGTDNDGLGGGIYVVSGTVSISNGSFTNNSADNGAALFNEAGVVQISGGSITSNESRAGGAIGVGGTTAKLHFSENASVHGNTLANSSEKRNVFLDQDTDTIINIATAGLNNGAEVGIYVPDKDIVRDNETANLFDYRGDICCEFGLYSGNSDDILGKVTNDRVSTLDAIGVQLTGKAMWSKPIKVEVRYLDRFDIDKRPPQYKGNNKYGPSDYYPSSKDMAFSNIADELRGKCNRLSGTSVYAIAFGSDATEFGQYLTNIVWDDTAGAWKYYRSGEEQTVSTDAYAQIYFSEPAYVSIENNTDLVLNYSSIRDYGLVVSKNSQIKPSLMPITAEDLHLEPEESITLLYPSAINKEYTFRGGFSSESVELHAVDVTCTGMEPWRLTGDKVSAFSWPGTTVNKNGGVVEIIFGGKKPVCKVVTTTISGIANNETAGEQTRDDGKVEYLFSSVGQAWEFIKNHSDHFKGTNQLVTAAIEMLVDYTWNETDNLDIPCEYDITLTTANDGVKRYPTTNGRAQISRDPNNKGSFFEVKAGAKKKEIEGETKTVVSTYLTVQDVRLDGKAITGSSDGGAIKTKDCKVTITNTEFKNFVAGNGGAVYVEYGDKKTETTPKLYTYYDFVENYYVPTADDDPYKDILTLTAIDVDFTDCVSKTTTGRAGGGAIHTNAMVLDIHSTVDKTCTFTNCTAGDQGGAVFHRIDGEMKATSDVKYKKFPYSYSSQTNISKASFVGCSANAAGGLETDSAIIVLNDCSFESCVAKTRNGGGMNVYALQNDESNAGFIDVYSNVTLNDCTFENCTAITNGGGFRSTAYRTTLNNCKFKETTASKNDGGGFAATYNKGKSYVVMNGCELDGCVAVQGKGGGIYTVAIEANITGTQIKNCSSANSGGGICYNSYNGNLIVQDGCIIENNSCSANGGGVYTAGHMTIINSYVRNNRLTTSTAANAAGVYMSNNKTLTVGRFVDINSEDKSEIINNTVAGGIASNLRLSSDANTGVNTAGSVSVQCNLKGSIHVVNARDKGKQFGSVTDSMNHKKPTGLADLDAVFVADDGSLYGIVDRLDAINNQKIIWAGDPICRMATEGGYQLFLNETCTESAIFDTLDTGTLSTGKNTAFSTLRGDVPLYIKGSDEPYTGTVRVEMLIPTYTVNKGITTPAGERNVVLTTAPKTTIDDSPYHYLGTGSAATLTRGTTLGDSVSMITSKCTMEVTKLTLDGNGTETTASGGLLKVTSGTTTIGNTTEFRNSNATNGGAAYVDAAGTLSLTSDGRVTSCSATSGGGIYVAGTFNMLNGTIEKCSATSGAGVFVASNGQVNASAGSIESNNATAKGGGMAIQDASARITFSGSIRVENNTLNVTTRCNVELDQDSWYVINSGVLTSSAHIGVYVPPENEDLFNKHGIENVRFGTHDGTNTDCLYCFVNDVNELKGGILKADGGIYWVKVFALEVGKTVVSGESKDFNKSFMFRVSMRDPDGITLKGKYGQLSFDYNGQALIYLKSGQTKTAENLLVGSTYVVEEVLSDTDKAYYGTIPAPDAQDRIVETGTIGENSTSTESKYVSNASFVNLSAVCKLTTSRHTDDRKLLYYQNAAGAYLPAVYSRLQLGFNAVDQELYEISGNSYVRYTGEACNVEMLVGNYSLPAQTTFASTTKNRVTLRTADPNADDGYRYRGTGTAVIQRGFSSGDSMLLTNSGSLALQDIVLDGYGSYYTAMQDGGIVRVQNVAELIVTTGATLRNSKVGTTKGAAVFVANGGTMTMNAGEINGNSVMGTGEGAGVYLEVGSTLNLSGSPNFGGTNATAGNIKNGASRQDIFIEGYAGEVGDQSATSLVVAGQITSGDGTIWVWPEETPHYTSLEQFAKLASGVSSLDNIANSLKAFRNARTNVDTGAEQLGVPYLYGILRGSDSENVYWYGIEGTRRVILRKVAAETYESLGGAEFTVYTNASGTGNPAKDVNGTELKDLPSSDNGIFFVGDLGYGTYYVKETKRPNKKGYDLPGEGYFFVVTVNENGVGYQYTEGGETLLSREVSATQS